MTAADESRVCTRAATWSLRRVSSCSIDDRRERLEAREGGTRRMVRSVGSVEQPREVLPDKELLSRAERQALIGKA
eukprot:3541527-Pleurochrysis_carterae.AAC.1